MVTSDDMDELDDIFYDFNDGLDQYDGLDMDILSQKDPFMPHVGKDHEYSHEKMHYVFVYGTMKKGFVNHGRIASRSCNRSFGKAWTQDYYLGMYARYSSNKTLAPAAVRSSAGCRIHGELYRVNGWTLNEMDIAEGCPHVYTRELTMIGYDGGNNIAHNAWIYIYEGSEEELITQHKSVRPFDSKGLGNGMLSRNRAFFGEDG